MDNSKNNSKNELPRRRNEILLFILSIIVLLCAPLSAFKPHYPENKEERFKTGLVTIENNTLIGIVSGEIDLKPETGITVVVTAYSSTQDQTDETPFITATGSHTRDGVIAANFLPFGTRVKFPTLYEDKIFVVEDRMKNNHKVDIWFSTREEALEFGIRKLPMIILENN